jgi:hypothetical protein
LPYLAVFKATLPASAYWWKAKFGKIIQKFNARGAECGLKNPVYPVHIWLKVFSRGWYLRTDCSGISCLPHFRENTKQFPVSDRYSWTVSDYLFAICRLTTLENNQKIFGVKKWMASTSYFESINASAMEVISGKDWVAF